MPQIQHLIINYRIQNRQFDQYCLIIDKNYLLSLIRPIKNSFKTNCNITLSNMFFCPFKCLPKKEDSDNGQYEYLRMKKISKMSIKMCEIFNKLNAETWKISQKRFTFTEYGLFFEMLIEVQACSLSILENESQEIMRLVPMPRFTNLRQLIINNNNVTNIEALEFLDAPKLTFLMMKDNQITSLKVLGKLRMDELQILCVSWNKVVSHEQLKALGRFVRDNKKQPWVSLEEYAYQKTEQYNWFEYEKIRYFRIQNMQQYEQFGYELTKNELYWSENVSSQMKSKLAHVPFLAKSIAHCNQRKRVKIMY